MALVPPNPNEFDNASYADIINAVLGYGNIADCWVRRLDIG